MADLDFRAQLDDVAQTDGLSASDLRDFEVSKEVAGLLEKDYPGHLWAVWASSEQGVIVVKNLALSSKFGFIIKLADVSGPADLIKRVRWAGGEFLERYRQRRGAIDHATLPGSVLLSKPEV